MLSKYAIDKIKSAELLSKSLESILTGTNIRVNPKNNKFESYGDGLIDDDFFIGNVFTNYAENIVVDNSNSYILSLPKKGIYSVTSSNKKCINTPNKNGTLVFPANKVTYGSPSENVEDYEIFIHKDTINNIIDKKYILPIEKPEILILNLQNDKIKALSKFIESTFFILRSFNNSQKSIFIRKNIKEISTLMLTEIIAEQIKAIPITNNHPEKGLVRKAEEIIENECNTILTIHEIADKLYTSPRNLQKAFKKHRDYTPMQFLRLRKLYMANKTIIANKTNKCTVKEIALGVGMHDLNRFSKYYADIFGELPSETIKNHSK